MPVSTESEMRTNAKANERKTTKDWSSEDATVSSLRKTSKDDGNCTVHVSLVPKFLDICIAYDPGHWDLESKKYITWHFRDISTSDK